MKITILSFLMAVSSMFLVQALTVINSTSKKIQILGGMQADAFKGNDPALCLERHKKIDLEKEWNIATVFADKRYYVLRNLTKTTKIAVIEYEGKIDFLVNEDGNS